MSGVSLPELPLFLTHLGDCLPEYTFYIMSRKVVHRESILSEKRGTG